LVETCQREPEVERALHLNDVVHVHFLLAVDRGNLLRRAEAEHALARREEAAAGEEEKEHADFLMPSTLQPPGCRRGQRSGRGVREELEALEHRVLADQRVVDGGLQRDEAEERCARKGRREQ